MRVSIIKIVSAVILSFCTLIVVGQAEPNENFRRLDIEGSEGFGLTKPFRIYQILCSRTGFHKFITSFGLVRDKGMEIEILLYSGPDQNKKMMRNYLGEDSIRAMYEGSGKIVFFATSDNKILWQPSDDGGLGYTAFNFPPQNNPGVVVSTLWIDQENNLYIGTRANSFYLVRHGAIITDYNGNLDSSGNFLVTNGKKEVKHIKLGFNIGVFAWAEDPNNNDRVWIGTNQGLFRYSKSTGQTENLLQGDAVQQSFTVTHLEVDTAGNLWFSSLEKGMGYYQSSSKQVKFFSGGKNNGKAYYAIKTFCRKSANELFVAVIDSVPAIFNTTTGNFTFIQDSLFNQTPDSTTDIKLDGFGNLLVTKGGGLFYTNYYKGSKPFAYVPLLNSAYAPFIKEILVNGVPYRQDGLPKGLKTIRLQHDQQSLSIEFSLAELIDTENVQFAWKVDGYIDDWVILPLTGKVQLPAYLSHLTPGRYIFRAKAKVGDEDWRKQEAELMIIIRPPFWKTWWFWTVVIAALYFFSYILLTWKIRSVRKQERTRTEHEKQLLEMEARALRAQMNPHFIFNCLNSIKALIQNRDHDRATDYLTTFSKLIRTLFQNSDKRQISLHDEIETCRLYTQLEAMRLNGKLKYVFDVDRQLDLKSLMVPALIIQPFIENAIWHGIVPKEEGTVKLTVKGDESLIVCTVEDDGIGRTMSKLNKPATQFGHESKGVNLSQARINLEKLLNETQASIHTTDIYEQDTLKGTRVTIRFNLN